MKCIEPDPINDPGYLTCDFDPYPDDPNEESFHFLRACIHCGAEFWSLHCACDGHTKTCPSCGIENKSIPCPCGKEAK